MKRNITIALDEDTARWVRVEAARRDSSVSQFLSDLLKQRMQTIGEYEADMKEFLGRRPVALKAEGARYPAREDLHERAGLR